MSSYQECKHCEGRQSLEASYCIADMRLHAHTAQRAHHGACMDENVTKRLSTPWLRSAPEGIEAKQDLLRCNTYLPLTWMVSEQSHKICCGAITHLLPT